MRAEPSLPLTGDESLWHDALRCFLVLEVVLGHLSALVLDPLPDLLHDPAAHPLAIAARLLTRFGPQAATLFVFLSGVLVGGGLLQARARGALPPLQQFVARRVNRIVPVALLALLLTAGLDGVAIHGLGLAQAYRHLPGYDAVASFTWPTFAANLLFLQPTFSPSFGSNGPLWTLGYIVEFYLVGYAVLAIPGRWAAIAALAVLLLVMVVVHAEWSVQFGVWLAGAAVRVAPTPRVPGRLALAIATLLFVASNLLPPLLSEGMTALTGACLIWATRGVPLPLPRWAVRPVRTLARESYALYAVHFPILIFCFAVLFEAKPHSTAPILGYTCMVLALVLGAGRVVSVLQGRLRAPAPPSATVRSGQA